MYVFGLVSCRKKGTMMNVEMKPFNNILGQIDGAYHDVAVRLGLSDSMFDILYILCEEGEGCNQSVLYKNSGLGKTTINSAIRRMEQQNLLYLTPGEGRNTCVYLTDAGREMLRTSVEPVIRIENEIFSSWTKKEQELFIGLNQRYLDMFREKTDHIGREKSK